MADPIIANDFANNLRYPKNRVQADFWDRNKKLYLRAERISLTRNSSSNIYYTGEDVNYIKDGTNNISYDISSLKTFSNIFYNDIDNFIKLILLSIIFGKFFINLFQKFIS